MRQSFINPVQDNEIIKVNNLYRTKGQAIKKHPEHMEVGRASVSMMIPIFGINVWDIWTILILDGIGNRYSPCIFTSFVYAFGYVFYQAGIILCMWPDNERRRYDVTSSFIGWAHSQNYGNDHCWDPFCWHELTLIPAWVRIWIITCPVKCEMKLLIHSQTSNAAQLKFENG